MNSLNLYGDTDGIFNVAGNIDFINNVSGSVSVPETVYERELEFGSHKDFPVLGNELYLYIATDENIVYRYDAQKQAYICVSGGNERDFNKNPIDLNSEVTGLLSSDMVSMPDLFDGDYLSLKNKPSIPDKISQLTNDIGFITSEIDPVYSADKSNIALKSELFSGSYNDLSDKPDLMGMVSDYINDNGFTADETDPVYLADKSNIALKSELFSGSYNDLSDKPELAVNLSQLDNDCGFTGDDAVSAHEANLSIHISDTDREAWNNKVGKDELNEIAESIEGLSETLGDIGDLSGINELFDKLDDLSETVKNISNFVGYVHPEAYGIEVDFPGNRYTRIGGAVGKTAGSGFDGIECFGGRKRCIVTDNGSILAYYGDSGYTESGFLVQEIIKDSVVYPVGTVVQVMVYQPRFYYQVTPITLDKMNNGEGYHLRKARYLVSSKKLNGFKLHPAFIKNGIEKPYILIGAFKGSVYNTLTQEYNLADVQNTSFTEDMLSSVASAKPASGLTQNLTRRNCGILAENRGVGWSQLYSAVDACTKLLFLIEYCAFNSQTAFYKGVVDRSPSTGNESLASGGTSVLGNTSGTATGTNGLAQISYRGQENLWGNIYEFVDGINIYPYGANSIYIADHDFTEAKNDEHYMNTGFTMARANGYMSAMGYNGEEYDWLFIPSEVSGTNSNPVGDYLTQKYSDTSGYLVAAQGGSWPDGLYAGVLCLNASNPTSFAARFYGGRLVYVPDTEL